MWANHEPRVNEDASQFNAASIDHARGHFKAWKIEQGKADDFPGYRLSVMIDEDCFQTLQNAPLSENLTTRLEDRLLHYVKISEGLEEEHEPPFPGDLTTQIVGWAIKIGDTAIPFASAVSPAAAVWGCATIFLMGIENFDTRKRALLSIAEQVTQAMFLGQLYSNIYTYKRTGDPEVIANLHKATVDSALDEAASLCEVTTKATHDKDFRNLQATKLFQRQYFQPTNEYEQQYIRNRVSKVAYASHHRELEERRKKDSGNWLIQHEEFLDGMHSPSSKVLWLQESHKPATQNSHQWNHD
ncbi:hypothetical protein MYU51_013721 [Penicillium brevicompactum]